MFIWKRLFLSYTTFNIFLCVFSLFYTDLTSIASANSLLVAVATTLMFVSVPFKIFIGYMRSIFPGITPTLAVIMHIIVHYGPVFVVGVHFNQRGAMIACVMMLLWYVSLRNHIQSIYTKEIPICIYDTIIIGSSMVILILSGICDRNNSIL